jgi:hypothetical protein
MSKVLTRRYIYGSTHIKIMLWAKDRNLRGPNRKENFPYFLEEYINRGGK